MRRKLFIPQFENLSMDNNIFQRFEMLVGSEVVNFLSERRIIIFGVGGVGGQAAESLVRAGLGHITIVDRDVVDITNINRQVIALHSTIGKSKIDVLKQRLLDINPHLEVVAIKQELNIETLEFFGLKSFDFIVDAIDSVKDKIALIKYCYDEKLNIICSMGAGNRLDPSLVYVTDIFKTNDDPLAKVIRSNLRKLEITKLVVVASKEVPKKTTTRTPASSPFVPPAFGLAIASYIVKYYLMYNIR